MKTIRSVAMFACAVGLAVPAAGAWAGKVTTLYSFQGGSDGRGPYAGVIAVGGTLYGTTEFGGTAGDGTVFAVDISTRQETVLYSFAGGDDGKAPQGGLIYHGGKLYGTTGQGGSSDMGTIFAVDPASGAETVAYTFKGRPDGAYPLAGLIYKDGGFYGTTERGGSGNAGSLFRFNPHSGKERVVWNFGLSDQDGSQPMAGLTEIGGDLYGTTSQGGITLDGTLFKFNPPTGDETIMHSFAGGNDGAGPMAAPGVHGGVLFGTTSCPPFALIGCEQVLGTAFSYDLSTGAYAVMYDFQGRGSKDGEYPQSTLVYHGSWVYGTSSGGLWNGGTIFKINAATHVQKSLHTFPSNSYPYAGLLPLNGAYYGTTATGGASGNGSVFVFVP